MNTCDLTLLFCSGLLFLVPKLWSIFFLFIKVSYFWEYWGLRKNITLHLKFCMNFSKLFNIICLYTLGSATGQTLKKDYFCPGTSIWIRKCPENSFGQICQIKGYKSQFYGVSGKNVVKLAFMWACFSQNHNTISSLFL